MSESSEEIPVWTWFTGQLLFEFENQLRQNPNKTIAEFFAQFLNGQNLQGTSFFQPVNQGTALMMMYGLLVVPKELWEKEHTHFQFSTRDLFSFKPPTDDSLDNFSVIRLLRNSISHANYSIEADNQSVSFWNINKGIKNFEVEINWNGLFEFISEIGKYYLNEVRAKKGRSSREGAN